MLQQTRSEIIKQLDCDDVYDVVVVGGGIHGAAFARLAAGSGFKVALFEMNDYASATSSRSSKMAHGGLRYLELGDFQQVFEGIKAREDLFENFPNLVKPHPFLIPVTRSDYWFKLKLGIGLKLYDLLVRKKERRHRWIAREKLNFPGYDSTRTDLEGCYLYNDGLFSDVRLVMENIYQARLAGADCLNYAKVNKIDESGEHLRVEWSDQLSGQHRVLSAGHVVNCAGPWVLQIGNTKSDDDEHRVVYSQGTHLIFDQRWDGPSIFLPMPGKARYYWVWPHYAGTMVGTTERKVEVLVEDPQPTIGEVDEILERLKRDLPDSGLDKSSLCYAFAGVRTLPVRPGSKDVTKLSRKHIWWQNGRVLNLLGGKFTTAEWTAWEGLTKLGKLTNRRVSEKPSLNNTPIKSSTKLTALTAEQQQRLIGRYSYRAADVIETDEDAMMLQDHLSLGELRYSIEIEQAVTIEDILRRRTELEYFPEIGLELLGKVFRTLSEYRPETELKEEQECYLKRLKELNTILHK